MHIHAWHSAIQFVSEFDRLSFDRANQLARNLNSTKIFTWINLITVVLSLGYFSMMDLCFATGRFEESDRDYYKQVLDYKKRAEQGKTSNETNVFPHKVRLIIDSEDFEDNHQTVIKAERYYDETSTKQVTLETITFPTFHHMRKVARKTPLPQLELDERGLFRLQSKDYVYCRPALKSTTKDGEEFTIWPEHKYPISKTIKSNELKASAFSIEGGKPNTKPSWGIYTFDANDLKELSDAYFCDTGSSFVLARVFKTTCEHADGGIFTITYALPTDHILTIQPDCLLSCQVRDKRTTVSLTPGKQGDLYKNRSDGTWEILGAHLKLKQVGAYEINSRQGQPWIKEVTLESSEGSNEHILTLLEKLPYLQEIAGLNFGGRVFSPDEQMRVAQLLAKTQRLISLNFAKSDNSVDYNSLVPAWLSQPTLSTLTVKNCGLSEANISALRQGFIDYDLATADGFPYLTGATGISVPEETHRWTDGKTATIQIPLLPHLRGLKCISFIDTSGGVIATKREQIVSVRCNGTSVGQYLYTTTNNLHTIQVPILDGQDTATINFEMPNAASPAELGVNPDLRVLSFNFGKVRFWFDNVIYNLSIQDGCPFKRTGFSVPERTHCWTNGKQAVLEVPVVRNHQRATTIRFNTTSAYVTEKHNQLLNVSVGDSRTPEIGREVAQYHYFTGDRNNHTILVPIPDDIDDTARITFDLKSKTISPIGDLRKLGILFKDMEMSFSTMVYNLAIPNGFPFAHGGFSDEEGTHRWTVGEEAWVEVPVFRNQRRLNNVSFVRTVAFVTANHSQVVEIFLNDRIVRPQRRYNTSDNNQTIQILIPTYLNTEKAKIKFKIRDPKSPAELQIGADPRKLGLSVGQVLLEYPLQVTE